MSDMEAEIEKRVAEPYGLFGLSVSLVLAIVLACVYGGLLAGAAALVGAALYGWSATLGFVRSLHAAGGDHDSNLFLYSAGIALYVAFAASILSLARFRGGSDWRKLLAWPIERPWWRDRSYWGMVLAGIVYGAAASAVLSQVYPTSKSWFTLEPGVTSLALSFVLIAIAAPIAEELVFRGWIYTSLRSRFGALASVIVSALLFANAHYESSHLYALAVFPVGLLLGFVRERAGTLWATIALHALYNFSGWLLTALGIG
jgi:membrane protease YdiL (CAAX protease family)